MGCTALKTDVKSKIVMQGKKVKVLRVAWIKGSQKQISVPEPIFKNLKIQPY